MRNIVIIIIISTQGLFSQQINQDLFGFRMSTSFIFFDIEDSSFVNQVTNINPKLLCFPGGFGNFYHLQGPGYGVNVDEVASYNKGIKSKLAKSLNSISKKKGHHENYIYDFISLAKKTEARIIFNINILTEPVEDYIRVLEIFKENNLEVVAVELGGELYTREYKDIIDGDLYIQLARSCAENIKRYYPEILIGVVAAPVNTLARHNLWNDKLSKEKFYDAIIVHSYAKVIKGQAQDGRMVLEEKESNNKKELFSIYKDRAITYLNISYPTEILEYNEAFNNKPIWITEWNFQMSKTTGNTMLQALFVPSYLLEVLTNAKLNNIKLSTFHNMAGRTLSASMILKKKDTTYILSTYKPMQMLSYLFQIRDYSFSREMIKKDCFKYIFNAEKEKIIFWVNWSENYIKDKIPNGKWEKKEYFGPELYSNTFENGITYDTQELREEINLKPYSFTMIIANE